MNAAPAEAIAAHADAVAAAPGRLPAPDRAGARLVFDNDGPRRVIAVEADRSGRGIGTGAAAAAIAEIAEEVESDGLNLSDLESPVAGGNGCDTRASARKGAPNLLVNVRLPAKKMSNEARLSWSSPENIEAARQATISPRIRNPRPCEDSPDGAIITGVSPPRGPAQRCLAFRPLTGPSVTMVHQPPEIKKPRYDPESTE